MRLDYVVPANETTASDAKAPQFSSRLTFLLLDLINQ
jgi:hypothetical protein